MGREIRRVPADWDHPKDSAGRYRPLYDKAYSVACAEWKAEFASWEAGTHPDLPLDSGPREFWDWDGGPPDRDSYRDREWTAEEATHFQLYETVSEGTPMTPPMPSRDALRAHLVERGDFWGRPWGAQAADRIVRSGWAPSLVIADGHALRPEDDE